MVEIRTTQRVSGYHVYQYLSKEGWKEVRVGVSAETGEEIPEEIPPDLPDTYFGYSIPVEQNVPSQPPQALDNYQRIISWDPEFIPPANLLESARNYSSISAWLRSQDLKSADLIVFGEDHSSIRTKTILADQLLPELRKQGYEYFATELFPANLQTNVNNYLETGQIDEKMRLYIQSQDFLGEGTAASYFHLLGQLKALKFKIIAAGPIDSYDLEAEIDKRLNLEIPKRKEEFEKEHGCTPSMEIGIAWINEVVEKVQLDYVNEMILRTDASIAEGIRKIPKGRKGIVLAGANHVIGGRKTCLRGILQKSLLLVYLFDSPLAMSSNFMKQSPPEVPRMELTLKTGKELLGTLLQIRPQETSLAISYPDRNILDWVIVF